MLWKDCLSPCRTCSFSILLLPASVPLNLNPPSLLCLDFLNNFLVSTSFLMDEALGRKILNVSLWKPCQHSGRRVVFSSYMKRLTNHLCASWSMKTVRSHDRWMTSWPELPWPVQERFSREIPWKNFPGSSPRSTNARAWLETLWRVYGTRDDFITRDLSRDAEDKVQAGLSDPAKAFKLLSWLVPSAVCCVSKAVWLTLGLTVNIVIYTQGVISIATCSSTQM